ncbi:hypothetical protein TRFO_23731 [Tritrichomonas foetus]|uniref:F5/8 type C domain-containing protein n=1 Tax=Tritrichomonas foetus TaxID=1144522 RepID=A0A1J4KAD5_9EUKA|nr:hypothetical protein TRFO_23731 [Tritrichomonas foetus]|eukprot:OHT07872.1 hypothetical protein TRFO_23731 [Tritrichomonas foetus]
MEEEKAQYTLNPENVKHIPLKMFSNDFVFYINGEKYETNRFIADLLSPKISQLHFIDNSINEYHINTQHRGDFKHFLDLGDFSPIFIPKNELSFFEEIFFLLGNEEYFSINPNFHENITIDNEISRIESKFNFIETISSKSINLKLLSEEINFISEHFYKFLEKEELKNDIIDLLKCEKDENDQKYENRIKMVIKFFEMIFQNSNLKLYDEDTLLNFILLILEKICGNPINFPENCYVFFENVKFEYLTQSSIRRFISIFDIDHLNSQIWLSICQRLVLIPNLENKPEINTRFIHQPIIKIPYKYTLDEGLFNYLRDIYLGDLFDQGIIEITSSSVNDNEDRYHPKNVLNTFDDNAFISQNLPNQWICLNLKNYRFQLLAYQIRSRNCEPNNHHLKSWVIEISNDCNEWEEIDRKTECKSLNGPKYHVTFQINYLSLKFVQYIRLRQIGKNYSSCDQLVINSLELYGLLIEV